LVSARRKAGRHRRPGWHGCGADPGTPL